MNNPNPPEFDNPGRTTDQKIFFELAEIRRTLARIERLATPTYRATPDGNISLVPGAVNIVKDKDLPVPASTRRFGRKKP